MTHIPEDKHFYAIDGKVLKNAEDLSVALRSMDHKTFHHHVTSHKNDFATWAREVLHDEGLAKRLLAAKSQEAMIKAVKTDVIKKPRYIDFLEGLALGIIIGLILAKLIY
ncbi:MAG: DUF5752 family protein [Candidatus Woesearchaeota archaeon]